MTEINRKGHEVRTAESITLFVGWKEQKKFIRWNRDKLRGAVT